MTPRTSRRIKWGIGCVAVTVLALASTAHAEEAPGEEWGVQWSNGLKIERNDGYHKIKAGGRLMVDFAAITGDDDLQGGNGTGVEVRRARIFTSGKLYDGRAIFKVQFDFADAEVALKDAYAGIAKIPALGTFRVGHFKEPFGLEQLGSSKYITFMERALTDEAFSPGRNIGISFDNQHLNKRLTWAVGGFRDTDDNGFGFSDEADYNLTGRVTGVPLYQDGGRFLIHLGTAYTHLFRGTGSPVDFRTRPESHLAPRYTDTGDIASDGVDKAGFEFATVLGPTHIQSEYVLSSVSRPAGDRANLHSVYVEAGWFVTGESRSYNLEKAAFERVKVKRPFLKDGGCGAWQIATRYSYVDLNDNFVTGGKEQNWTVGLNWHLYSNFRFMTNYIHAKTYDNPSQNGNANIFQARVQIDY